MVDCQPGVESGLVVNFSKVPFCTNVFYFNLFFQFIAMNKSFCIHVVSTPSWYIFFFHSSYNHTSLQKLKYNSN